MRKEIVYGMAVALCAASLLTACGSKTEAPAENTTEATTQATTEATTEAVATTEMAAATTEADNGNYFPFTDENMADQDVIDFATTVQMDFENHAWDCLVDKLAYPITIKGIKCEDEDAFMSVNWDEEFSDDFLKAITETDVEHMDFTAEGAMFGDGQVWISPVVMDDESVEMFVIAINAE